MFNFKRDGTQVTVEIESKSNVEKRWFVFRWNCNDEVYADLLTSSFKQNFIDKLQKARREAYDQGFKDAKSKRAKETWFGGYL